MKKLILLALTTLLTLSGCATNPVTGKKEFSIVSEEQELAIGKQQYAPMRQAQGGDLVIDPRLTAYVREVGERLARVSDRKLPYEFNIINSSVPNAWALPGGKIVVNRGLLTALRSENELAAVLGHEITHAAARHGARAMSRGLLVQGAMLGAVIASQGKDYAQLAQLGASIGGQLITQKYGRDAEREADFHGMKYMSKAGYDPQGAVELQKTFVKLFEKHSQDWLSGLFASHPPSAERVQNNIKTAAGLPKGGEVGETRYQSHIARLMRAKPAYDAYDKARKALADGDISTARALANQAVGIEPREGHFYALLGDIELKQNHPRAAKIQYDRAIRHNDSFFYYYVQRGLVNEELHQNAQAKADLEKSLSLLPTADAYNGLGILARAEGDIGKAKEYFAKASQDKGSAGKAALGSLVDLDLSANPGKYLGVRAAKNLSGGIIAEISNPTPRAVTGIVLDIQVADASGHMRRIQRSINGTLAAGHKDQVDLGLSGLTPAQLKTFQISVVGARVAR
ncbi:MAG TPA: peptidase M48 [Gammaproteobacteria bacterium]|nr:peptidase M48 [Gammaproteobacteria bacterium]